MPTSQPAPQWHILTFIPDAPGAAADKIIHKFNRSISPQDAPLTLFHPKYSLPTQKQGKIQFRSAPLTFFYTFIRGTLPQIKQLCALRQGFAFLIDRAGKNRYATVSDPQMKQFMTIARAYSNTLPFFSPADIDIAAGDLVEVITGDFPGLRGHYIPNPRSKTGTIILQVDQGLATAAFNIRADQIRILQFAPASGREYDQIDHFIPRLLKALRLSAQNQPLPRPLASQIAVFTSRMQSLTLQNQKLQPKLDALLLGAHHILGQQTQALQKLKKLTPSLPPIITNPWTKALVLLIIALSTSDPAPLNLGLQQIAGLTPQSKLQLLITQEYELNRPLLNP
ncbi:MAG: hypothetical protein HDR87_03640 [Bacteroides sp.]|nr:hypothetical protein [Bacteroides sp.]